ncbi:uncharacterized protein LOC101241849 [Hydra vulgaris]|uniref:uncharacterized protein LOC101241849 n=1 Tax=Hydra vulgaris TaxID=6087 RepID=UPI001F5EB401|nr:uncharacterized protein LOC101241849 [Hydra vulgaris]
MVYLLFLLSILHKETFQSFTMVNDTEIKENQLLVILTNLPKEYELSFNFKPTKFLNKSASVIHLTQGGDKNKYGDRTPCVWVSPDNYLYFSSAINGTSDTIIKSHVISPLNEWTKIKITQFKFRSEYLFTVEIANHKIYNVQNINPMNFNNVKVYLGSPWMSAQPGFIKNLIIANACAEILFINGQFKIKKNHLVKTLHKLLKEYELSFELLLTSYTKYTFTNIIHLTIGDNENIYGARIASLFIRMGSYGHFGFSLNNKINEHLESDNLFQLNNWTTIKISQIHVENKYMFNLWVAENLLYSVENISPTEFTNVMVYISNPWYEEQPGFIRNVIIKNGYAAEGAICKPLLNVIINELFTNKSYLSVNTSIGYVYERGLIAYNVAWEYFLPYFSTKFPKSKEYYNNGLKYGISGAFITTGVNQYMNISLDTTNSLLRGDFTLEIPLKISYQNSAGDTWNQYVSIKKVITQPSNKSPIVRKSSEALKGSYGRGICLDEIESSIYACMNLYVETHNTACFKSTNYGEQWKRLDLRVGSILGHHTFTRDLYGIHRNQKTYLTYDKTYRKWLVITNDEFETNISNKLNDTTCLKLEGNNEQVFMFHTQQWMGNDTGLFYRKFPSESWFQRVDWNTFS